MPGTREQIGVIGLGNWGTALANHLSINGHDVLGWCLEPEIAEGINSAHKNCKYLSQVLLSSDMKATNDLSRVLERDIIVVVFPSSVLGEMTPRLKLKPGTLLISAIKGLEKSSLKTPLQYFVDRLDKSVRLAAFSGPSFAKDIVAQKPSGIVSASPDEKVATTVSKLFASSSMRIYLSTDPLGVEIGAVVKNVIALAAGVSDGLELGDSARAGLITRGLAEMVRLAVAIGAEERTLFGLSGLGDLVMTSTCDASRNRTVGIRLGRGESLKEIIATLGSVAEGVTTTPLVLELAKKNKVDMPITEEASRLIRGEITAKEMAKNLLSRPLKKEFA